MHAEYDWIFVPPGESLVAHMNTTRNGKAFFDATLQLQRRPWNSRELLRVAAAYPFMTLRVIGAIHWEALKLLVKGVPVYTHSAKLARCPQLESTATVKIAAGENVRQ